jgi:biotin carboxyl carrier protein
MPGKVTKLFVSDGQEVKKGDSLLVMEAMKMEYTLKADANGSVEKITAKTGDQVTLGQLLVQLKLTEKA